MQGFEEAKDWVDKTVLEAEKFKATFAEPGKLIQFDNKSNGIEVQIPNIGCGVSDDDFFHLTCHIDPNLIHKIEKGELVELGKLLPKDKLNKMRIIGLNGFIGMVEFS